MDKRPRNACGLLILGLAALSTCTTTGASHTSPWGKDGAGWTPQSRLPDFSRAGYLSGYGSIPEIGVTTDVKDFGARGDGETDDSDAFLAAIEATDEGAIWIPPGRYVITSVLKIDKSGVVLRGAGPALTTFVIPKPLQELDPVTLNSAGQLPYSFRGAFVTVEGKVKGARVAGVIGAAKRGDTWLQVDETKGIRAGDWLRLLIRSSRSLGSQLHAGETPGEDSFTKHYFVDTVFRVASVRPDSIELDRPLRVAVQPEWNPILRSYEPTVQNVGIEGITFEFPGTPKPRHFLEQGFNAIQILGAANSWVRDVTVIDGDMGIKAVRARFCQIERVRFVESNRSGETGHHGLWASGDVQDCLFSEFEFATTYVHDISVEGFAHGNVFRKGRGVAINFDHHRNGPYENLFTDIHVGSGHRMWNSGGRGDRGPHSGARTTVWNVQYDGKAQKAPSTAEFPQMNIFGIRGYGERSDSAGMWVQSLGEGDPPDLYDAQRARLDKRGR